MTLITVGGRASPLSQAQIREVLHAIQEHHPHVMFTPYLVDTRGDKDQTISLRKMEKTDFFTQEVDDLLLAGQCRVAIHSAKDLPDPIPKGLSLVALTKGLDSSDALVFRQNESLSTLRSGAIVATSSDRREAAVRRLRTDLHFIDVRGTIAQRLAKLDCGEADAVVVAEAALIRLGLTHLNRMLLLGSTTPYQGQLAVLARDDDREMHALFSCLGMHVEKACDRILYLGIVLPEALKAKNVIHYPIIEIVSRSLDTKEIQETFSAIPEYTHLILTSQPATHLFFKNLLGFNFNREAVLKKQFICVGKATARTLEQYGIQAHVVAREETAEGIVNELEQMDCKETYFFWPHSAHSRPVITNFFKRQQIKYRECCLYDTRPKRHPHIHVDFAHVDEIVFTSPSTVDAFIEIFGPLPAHIRLTSIGPVTQTHITNFCQE